MKAKDINSQKFEKAAFGYKQEDVDGFLNELAADYSQLEKDNEEINAKLQVLADKVREYRKDEDAVRDALLFAQKEGHRVVSEANSKAEEVLNNAKLESDKIINNATLDSRKAIEELKAELKREQDNLSYLQKKVSEFKKNLFDMYKSHLELISSVPQFDDDDDDDEEEENIAVSTPVVNKTVQNSIPNTAQPQYQQYQKYQAAQPQHQPQPQQRKAQVPFQPQYQAPQPPQTQQPAEMKENIASGKLDPFRTQTIPVINAGESKYAELQFGQQKNK